MCGYPNAYIRAYAMHRASEQSGRGGGSGGEGKAGCCSLLGSMPRSETTANRSAAAPRRACESRNVDPNTNRRGGSCRDANSQSRPGNISAANARFCARALPNPVRARPGSEQLRDNAPIMSRRATVARNSRRPVFSSFLEKKKRSERGLSKSFSRGRNIHRKGSADIFSLIYGIYLIFDTLNRWNHFFLFRSHPLSFSLLLIFPRDFSFCAARSRP